MIKEKLEILTSTCVPLKIDNVNTDQIIPARYLKATTREGFGENLFRDWRYDIENKKIDSFVLNNIIYKGTILVTGKNFGSGSSREHAAWAIADYGFKAIVSSSFADIFKNNAMNNFVLPIIVTPLFIEELFNCIFKNPNTLVEINLPQQTITNKDNGKQESFQINAYKKYCLLNGFDDIDFLLSKKNKIEQWEKKRKHPLSL
ncbi:MAG: 3-isopropylmalate dehydratase small subunit [Chitinophagaceae bacterium]